jgi:hypothetical protein
VCRVSEEGCTPDILKRGLVTAWLYGDDKEKVKGFEISDYVVLIRVSMYAQCPGTDAVADVLTIITQCIRLV